MTLTLLIIVCFLQFADAWTTHRLIERGFVERNKGLRWLFEKTGVRAVYVVKGLTIIALLAAYFYGAHLVDAAVANVALGILAFYYFTVVTRNWKRM